MEVNGKEFMRNVGIEQDKERLAQEQKRLEALKREAYLREEESRVKNTENNPFLDLSLNSTSPSNKVDEPTIEDIKLTQDDPNKTKKKYVLLGIALILVFVITILVIRLISNSDTEEKMENLNPQHKEVTADKILDKIDSNQEYQKAIDQNLAKEESQKLDEAKQSAVPDVVLDGEKVENTPLVIETPKPQEELKKDLFGLNEQEKAAETAAVQQEVEESQSSISDIYKKMEEADENVTTVTQKTVNVIPKTTQKQSSIEPAKETKLTKTVPTQKTKSTSQKAVSGYYIQVGAFTKEPNRKLLEEISSKGFSYVVHPMVVKGTKYNKVLIGAYPTRTAAQNDLNNVKQKLKKSGAYILKI